VQLDCGHFAVVTGERSALLTKYDRCKACGKGSPFRRIVSFLGPAEAVHSDPTSLKAIPAATCAACGGRVAKPAMFSSSEWPCDETVGLREEYLLGSSAYEYETPPKGAQALVDQALEGEARPLAKKDIGGQQQRLNSVTV
jgi:hypothetical protein